MVHEERPELEVGPKATPATPNDACLRMRVPPLSAAGSGWRENGRAGNDPHPRSAALHNPGAMKFS